MQQQQARKAANQIRMLKSSFKSIGISLVAGLLFLGDTQSPPISILAPVLSDSISYDNGIILLASVTKEFGTSLLVSTQWEIDRWIDLGTESAKEDFAKNFYKLIAPEATIERIRYCFVYSGSQGKAELLEYPYADTMTIRALWPRKEFVNLVKLVQTTPALGISLSLRGWKDSIVTTEYDDPIADNRLLYKMHVNLVSGQNTIYLAHPEAKRSTTMFVTTLATENKSLTDRTNRYHASELEQNCSVCHEGLPSADEGMTMTADCGVCHKALGAGPNLHAPVEMNECSACHSWSADNKVMHVAEGIPSTCYTCHDEKKTMVEEAPVPHAVADDCTMCHAPHSTSQPSLLRRSVYDLCTGCHEDYAENHPVSGHPLRFISFETRNGKTEEISCVSCHDPHGSKNRSLLRVGGSRMAICIQCHKK